MLAEKVITILRINSEFLKLLIGSTLTVLILFYGILYQVAYSQSLIYSDPLLISTDTNILSTMAASSLDKNGKIHIVFVGWYYEYGAPDDVAAEIFYTNNLTGVFSEPIKLPSADNNSLYYSKEPSIAVDFSGTVHVAYYRVASQLAGAGSIFYTNSSAGEFSEPKNLNNSLDPYSGYYSYGKNIMLAASLDNDSIHIVFDGNSGTGHGGARYSVGHNGEFYRPITITQRSNRPTIKLDNYGILNIIYWINEDTTDIFSNVNLVRSKIVNGQFTSPEILYMGESSFSQESAFAFDQNDTIHVVFRNLDLGIFHKQMQYVKGKDGFYSTPEELPTANWDVSLMYSIEIGNNQTKYIAYKIAGDNQSLGFMYNDGSGFKDISPVDDEKYGFMSAGPQRFTLDKDNNIGYFVYTTGLIYMVTIDLNTISAVNTHKELSREFRLSQNYPNPFNPTTTIKFSLRNPSNVILKIYNLSGQEIATLINEFHTTGDHEITWQPRGLPSGIYFYKLQAGKFSDTKKLILQK